MQQELGLFQGFGVELGYMIVGRAGLDVYPVADKVLEVAAGESVSDVELGRLAWSNELVLHVIELKTNGPAPGLTGLAEEFQRHVRRINEILAPLDGRLMPTGAHPWMDPMTQARLWPHEYSPIYEAYDRIFGCRGHGWSNLQSAHINLPFSGDDEFARLHAAIRLVLPIMPALTASSPILNAKLTGFADSRMQVYLHNSARIPSVAGRVVPEQAFSRRQYFERILAPMYRDIEPHDPDGILQYEWLNSRGAIARFDRGSIEIRVLDVQECPRADLALAGLITAAIKAVTEEKWIGLEEQKAWDTHALADVLLLSIRHAQSAVIENPAYLRAFGISGETRLSAGDLWRHLRQACLPEVLADPSWTGPIERVLTEGSLSRRITAALGREFGPDEMRQIYARLCDCLDSGETFGS